MSDFHRISKRQSLRDGASNEKAPADMPVCRGRTNNMLLLLYARTARRSTSCQNPSRALPCGFHSGRKSRGQDRSEVAMRFVQARDYPAHASAAKGRSKEAGLEDGQTGRMDLPCLLPKVAASLTMPATAHQTKKAPARVKPGQYRARKDGRTTNNF
jgi:hypothetical protein